jgi:hypothetical protein
MFIDYAKHVNAAYYLAILEINYREIVSVWACHQRCYANTASGPTVDDVTRHISQSLGVNEVNDVKKNPR